MTGFFSWPNSSPWQLEAGPAELLRRQAMVPFEQPVHVALIGKSGGCGQLGQARTIADTGAEQPDTALRLQGVRC